MPDDDVDKEIYKSLRREIKMRWQDQWIEAGWKDRAFRDFTNENDLGKICVSKAIVHIATDNEVVIHPETLKNLQAQVTLDTTPKAIEPSMRAALSDVKPMINHLA